MNYILDLLLLADGFANGLIGTDWIKKFSLSHINRPFWKILLPWSLQMHPNFSQYTQSMYMTMACNNAWYIYPFDANNLFWTNKCNMVKFDHKLMQISSLTTTKHVGNSLSPAWETPPSANQIWAFWSC